MNRKLLKIVLISVVCIAFSAISVFATETVFEGIGTEESPYLIQNSDDIEALAELVNSGDEAYVSAFYKLTDDVSLTGINHTPIGTSESPFSGSFDGAGFIISDMKIESDAQHLGFFGYTKNAALNDIHFKNSEIIYNGSDTVYAAILAGIIEVDNVEEDVYVSNCSAEGTLNVYCTEYSAYVAGIVGKATASNAVLKFTNCYVDINLTVQAKILSHGGGVIGKFDALNNSYVSVSDSIIKGSVKATSLNSSARAAGVVAYANQQEADWSDFVPVQPSEETSLFAQTTIYNFNRCVVDCEIQSVAPTTQSVATLVANSTEHVITGVNYVSSEKAFVGSDKSISCSRSVSSEILMSKEYLSDTVGFDFINAWTLVFGTVKLRTATPYIVAEYNSANKVVNAQPVGCTSGNLVVAVYVTNAEKDRLYSVRVIPCIADIQEILDIPVLSTDDYKIKLFMLGSTTNGPLCKSFEINKENS